MNVECFLNPEAIYRIVSRDIEKGESALADIVKQCSFPEEVFDIYMKGKLSLSAINYKNITHNSWDNLKIPLKKHPIFIFSQKFNTGKTLEFINKFYETPETWIYYLGLAI